MSLETWWLFLGAIVLIASTPGPNVLYVTTRSIRFGMRASIVAMMGCLLALVLMLVRSVAGLSALLITLPAAFDALRYLGAAYLIWLGIQTWRARDEPEDAAIAAPEASLVATFRGGFLVGISNPKLLIFAAAFFPQFITQSAPSLPQFALLVATFVAVELSFYLVYALSGRRLAAHLVRGAWRRRLNRASGVIFAGFGVALLRYRP
ncbi:LysE family translocator [Reyranella soli]|uniref:Amino acid transporter n=1 Tax=Reyranella soli TaxID=1230389 RepID=A0A512NLT6_9HYPH|nr:LysE family translocator [Reyranella soli]GEP59911.1 amino acid transporter [Reyranella soli]